jgi:hypothetical protein
MGKSLGQIAYEGYFAFSNGKSLISGAQLPTWEAQDERIRNAWEAAAFCVLQQVKHINLPA